MTSPRSPKKAPDFRPGDTVRVHLKVVEGESERIQVFEGVVLRRRGVGASETFTVRKISFGVGVERIFPLNSPRIERIELSRPGRARRARLYYLRNLTGKAARLDSQSREGEAATQGPAAGSPAAGGAKAAPSGAPAAPSADGGAKAPPAASAAPAVR